ncbi:MAG: tetratricopeptide repeat protein [Candidatus Moduliflexus flocculans]|nr:tetratricopeptide repeat protein [Candidatus Moduliflexus flocculans]
MSKRALAIRREKALSPDHADLAVSLDCLARIYLDLDRYAEAEPLLERLAGDRGEDARAGTIPSWPRS